MCCPLPLLKTLTIFGAVLLLVASCGMLGATIYAFVKSEVIVDQTSSLQKGILIGLIVGEVFLILGAIAGIVGSKMRNACLLFLFTLVVVLFTFVFIGLGIASNYVPDAVFKKESCETSDLQWIAAARQVYAQSFLLYCSDKCPCNLYNHNGYSNQQISVIRDILNKTIDDPNGNIKFQNCQAFKDIVDSYTYQLTATFDLLQYTLGCSGWCEGDSKLLRVFSNINDGKPTSNCYPKLKSYVIEYSHIVMWVSIGFAIYLALVVLANFCICCHPERKHLRGFNRFVDDDQGFNAYSNQGFNNQGAYQRYH